MNAVSDIDAAYTAGLFDGEGSVSLSMWKGRKLTKEGLPSNSPMLLVQLTSTDFGIIDWLVDTWGVGKKMVGYRPKRPEHSVALRWHVTSNAAARVLARLLPYLRIKREQARLGMEYQALKVSSRKIGGEEMIRRMAYRDRMLELNKRGGKVPNKFWADVMTRQAEEVGA